jgi:hypothetical protein
MFALFQKLTVTLHICKPSVVSKTWGSAMPWWQGTNLTRIKLMYFIPCVIFVVSGFFQSFIQLKLPRMSRATAYIYVPNIVIVKCTGKGKVVTLFKYHVMKTSCA